MPSSTAKLTTRSLEFVKEYLHEENPDALLAEGLEEALVGVARRCGQPTLAVYSYAKAVELLMRQGLTDEEACEHLEFNVLGAWLGPHTPVFLVE